MTETTVSEAAIGVVAAPVLRVSPWWSLTRTLRRTAAATWFLALALPVGLYLTIAIPPGQGLDEPNHFYRVYQVSTGQLVSQRLGNDVGGVLPACAVEYLRQMDGVATSPTAFAWPAFAMGARECDPAATTFVDFANTAVYSPVSYLPQVLGVAAARLAGAPLPWLFVAGRVAGLMAYLALVYLALRLAPAGRIVILVVGLMPMALTSASEYSADGMTIALSLVLVAGVIRCCTDPETTWRTFVLAGAAALGLALSKSTYFVLAPLLLLVPGRLFPSGRVALAARVAVVGAIGLAAVGWYLEVGPLALGRVVNGIDPHAQIQYILGHPLRYVRLVAMTLLGPTTTYFTWPGFVAWVGFTRNAAAGTPQPPIVVVLLGFVILALAYRHELARPLRWSAGLVVRAGWPVALVVANMVLIVTVLYLTDAVVGTRVYWHVHGRYFLPLAAVPAVSVGLLAARPGQGGSALPYAAGMSVLLAYVVGKVAIYFY